MLSENLNLALVTSALGFTLMGGFGAYATGRFVPLPERALPSLDIARDDESAASADSDTSSETVREAPEERPWWGAWFQRSARLFGDVDNLRALFSGMRAGFVDKTSESIASLPGLGIAVLQTILRPQTIVEAVSPLFDDPYAIPEEMVRGAFESVRDFYVTTTRALDEGRYYDAGVGVGRSAAAYVDPPAAIAGSVVGGILGRRFFRVLPYRARTLLGPLNRYHPWRYFNPEMPHPPTGWLHSKEAWELQVRSFVRAVNRAEDHAYAHGWRPSSRRQSYFFLRNDIDDNALRLQQYHRRVDPVFGQREGWSDIVAHETIVHDNNASMLHPSGALWHGRDLGGEMRRTGYSGQPVIVFGLSHEHGIVQGLADQLGRPIVALNRASENHVGVYGMHADSAWQEVIPAEWKSYPKQRAPSRRRGTNTPEDASWNDRLAHERVSADVDYRWRVALRGFIDEGRQQLLEQRGIEIHLWGSDPHVLPSRKPPAVDLLDNELRLDIESLGRLAPRDLQPFLREEIDRLLSR